MSGLDEVAPLAALEMAGDRIPAPAHNPRGLLDVALVVRAEAVRG